VGELEMVTFYNKEWEELPLYRFLKDGINGMAWLRSLKQTMI